MAAQSVASVRVNRWVILAGYALLTACTQWLWLAYAPITTQTHQIMRVSEGAVGDLAGIFPFVYVILALPAGRWLDARFGRALGLGAVLTATGGLLRLAGPSSYGWAVAGQFVIAAGQPFVVNSITKVGARYFPSRERTVAVSIGSVALFAGILAAVLSGVEHLGRQGSDSEPAGRRPSSPVPQRLHQAAPDELGCVPSQL